MVLQESTDDSDLEYSERSHIELLILDSLIRLDLTLRMQMFLLHGVGLSVSQCGPRFTYTQMTHAGGD